MTAQRSCTDTCTAQVTAPGLFGGFSFRGLKKLKGGFHESTPQPRGKNTVKRNSERRIPRMSSENWRLFTGANSVVRPTKVITYKIEEFLNFFHFSLNTFCMVRWILSQLWPNIIRFSGTQGWTNNTLAVHEFIPKLLLRLLWFFRRIVALFRQIRTFPQLFWFCSDLGFLDSDKFWETVNYILLR